MTIDLNRYRRVVKPTIELFRNREPKADLVDLIGRIAVASSCPIIAVAHYYKELYGDTPELKEFTNNLMFFYKVDSVVGEVENE